MIILDDYYGNGIGFLKCKICRVSKRGAIEQSGQPGICT